MRRRVVCAAIRGRDGSLLLGIRHYSRDMYDQIERRTDARNFVRRLGEDQGFVDQHGVYMTRIEAYKVAMDARQPVKLSACIAKLGGEVELTSEALY